MAGRRALDRRAGISLVELIVVAAVAMVLLGLAVPVIQGNDTAGSAARLLVADAVRARSFARRVWEPVTMQVDTNNERWRTLRESGVPLVDANTDADGWRSAEPGVDFRPVEGQPTDLVFLPNGRATQSTAVFIVVGDDLWRVSVDALNARIQAFEEGQL
jgi:Tfp pilus assembly protein FimT